MDIQHSHVSDFEHCIEVEIMIRSFYITYLIFLK